MRGQGTWRSGATPGRAPSALHRGGCCPSCPHSRWERGPRTKGSAWQAAQAGASRDIVLRHLLGLQRDVHRAVLCPLGSRIITACDPPMVTAHTRPLQGARHRGNGTCKSRRKVAPQSETRGSGQDNRTRKGGGIGPENRVAVRGGRVRASACSAPARAPGRPMSPRPEPVVSKHPQEAVWERESGGSPPGMH